jgi:hypothetical protein
MPDAVNQTIKILRSLTMKKTRVEIFTPTGQHAGFEEFDTTPEAIKFCQEYGEHNSGFATIIDKPKPGIEATPQDKGVPSPVPFSLIIRQPSSDIDTQGRPHFHFSGAYKSIDDMPLAMLPGDIMGDVERMLRKVFESGAYRIEMVIGDWEIKVYKHPNNP